MIGVCRSAAEVQTVTTKSTNKKVSTNKNNYLFLPCNLLPVPPPPTNPFLLYQWIKGASFCFQLSKRDVMLQDKSGKTVVCTFWGADVS